MTTVGEAMLRFPKVCTPDTVAADLWELFADDHVHLALVADRGRLITVVERGDLAGVPADAPATSLGRLHGRTVRADTEAASTHRRMLTSGERRLAVVDGDGLLVGLLCLKRSGDGFCTDDGVAARAAERAATAARPEYDAVILAGGRASRMGGTDKTRLRVGGSTLIERVEIAVADARSVVVVGPQVDGGPVAALASALPGLTSDLVVTLAGDLPFVGGGIRPLLESLGTAEAAVLVAGGRRQHLAAAWRRRALTAAVAALDSPVNAPMRRLFDGIEPVEVPDPLGWSTDVDTPADLAAARAVASR